MPLREMLRRFAADRLVFGVALVLAACALTIDAHAAALEFAPGQASMKTASISTRQTGSALANRSLEMACAEIAQSVSEGMLKSRAAGAQTKELKRLMKGLRCVE